MTSGIFSCRPVCRKGVKSCIVRAARSRPCSHTVDTLYKPGSKVCERSREPKPLKEAQTKFRRSQSGVSAKADIRTANVTRAKLTAAADTAQPSNPPAQPLFSVSFLSLLGAPASLPLCSPSIPAKSYTFFRSLHPQSADGSNPLSSNPQSGIVARR